MHLKATEYLLKIQTDSSHNILIGTQPLRDNVRIIHHIPAEKQGTADSEYEVERAREGDEDPYEAGHD